MHESRLGFSAKRGFHFLAKQEKQVLTCPSIAKITTKFADSQIKSPYFAAFELRELMMLSYSLEKEQLKRKPHYQEQIKAINAWFAKSQLRQSQIKDWLRSAPQLFVNDVLRTRDFNLLQQGKQAW